MLVLTRMPKESIIIRTEKEIIKITYLKPGEFIMESTGKSIKDQIVLGIDAPKHYLILREEIS